MDTKTRTEIVRESHHVEELRELITVFSHAFEAKYSVTDTYLQSMLNNSAAIILGVCMQSRIVGGLVAFEMTPIHGSKELYIYDIAIHPDFQNQGLGALLIEHIKTKAKQRGIGTVFVEAESEDTGAVAFYRAIGGEDVSVNHFNFTIK